MRCALTNKHNSGFWRVCRAFHYSANASTATAAAAVATTFSAHNPRSLVQCTVYTKYVVVENAFHVIKMVEIDTQNTDGSFLVHLDKQYVAVNMCVLCVRIQGHEDTRIQVYTKRSRL